MPKRYTNFAPRKCVGLYHWFKETSHYLYSSLALAPSLSHACIEFGNSNYEMLMWICTVHTIPTHTALACVFLLKYTQSKFLFIFHKHICRMYAGCCSQVNKKMSGDNFTCALNVTTASNHRFLRSGNGSQQRSHFNANTLRRWRQRRPRLWRPVAKT